MAPRVRAGGLDPRIGQAGQSWGTRDAFPLTVGNPTPAPDPVLTTAPPHVRASGSLYVSPRCGSTGSSRMTACDGRLSKSVFGVLTRSCRQTLPRWRGTPTSSPPRGQGRHSASGGGAANPRSPWVPANLQGPAGGPRRPIKDAPRSDQNTNPRVALAGGTEQGAKRIDECIAHFRRVLSVWCGAAQPPSRDRVRPERRQRAVPLQGTGAGPTLLWTCRAEAPSSWRSHLAEKARWCGSNGMSAQRPRRRESVYDR